MEMQLDKLIEKIKQDGIEESNKQSQQILKQAEDKKEAIIKQAQMKADLILKEAKDETGKLKDNAHKAIDQAVRDAVLNSKEKIKSLFEAFLKKEIQQTLDQNFMRELIVKIAESWIKDKGAELEVSLSQQDKQKLEKLVIGGMQKELAKGLTFKVNSNVNKGLYISTKGEDFHYDFTDESISEILRQHLRPFIAKIIDRDKKENK